MDIFPDIDKTSKAIVEEFGHRMNMLMSEESITKDNIIKKEKQIIHNVKHTSRNECNMEVLSTLLYMLYPPEYQQFKEDIILELMGVKKNRGSFQASGGFTECCPGVYPYSPLTTCCQDIDVMNQFSAQDLRYDGFEVEFDPVLRTYIKLIRIRDGGLKQVETEPWKDWIQKYWTSMTKSKTTGKIHGPAVELELLETLDTSKTDHTFLHHFIGNKMDQLVALKLENITEIQQILFKWYHRKRAALWPNNIDAMTICQCPCFAVPVGSDIDPNHWRVSFSLAEKILLQRSKYEIKMVYTTCKMLMKQHTSIPTYYLKTVLFWTLEDVPQYQWHKSRLSQLVFVVLQRLFLNLCECRLPHYFIPEHNLLLEKEPHMVKTYCKQLNGFQNNILGWFNTCLLKTFIQCNDLQLLINPRLQIHCPQMQALLEKIAINVIKQSLTKLYSKSHYLLFEDPSKYSNSLYDVLSYSVAVLVEWWQIKSGVKTTGKFSMIIVNFIDILLHGLAKSYNQGINKLPNPIIESKYQRMQGLVASVALENMLRHWVGKQPMVSFIYSKILIYGFLQLRRNKNTTWYAKLNQQIKQLFSVEEMIKYLNEMTLNLQQVFQQYKNYRDVLDVSVHMAAPELMLYCQLSKTDVHNVFMGTMNESDSNVNTTYERLYQYAMVYSNILLVAVKLQENAIDDFNDVMSKLENMETKCKKQDMMIFPLWQIELFSSCKNLHHTFGEPTEVGQFSFVKVNVCDVVQGLRSEVYSMICASDVNTTKT